MSYPTGPVCKCWVAAETDFFFFNGWRCWKASSAHIEKRQNTPLLSRVRWLWFTGERSEIYRRRHAENLPNTVSRTAKFIFKKSQYAFKIKF